METWLILLSLPLFLYALLMILFTIGFWLPDCTKSVDIQHPVSVSIIIPFRDEAENLPVCLESLSRQAFPPDFMEIICVDDESTDGSATIIQAFMKQHPGLKVQLLHHTRGSGQEAYKKSCIRRGIDAAVGEWIVTLDADVVVEPEWLTVMANAFRSPGVSMVIGPVAFSGNKTLFGTFQQLEFAGLIGSTAGAAGIGLPFMCNGANLAYKKNAYHQVKGFDNDVSYVSGDDVFLLLKMKKQLGARSITFARQSQAVVWTKPAPSWRSFLHQRIRWISKTRGYQDAWILSVEAIVYLAHLYWPTMFVCSIFVPDAIWLVLLYPVVKSLVELPLLFSITSITHQKHLLWLLLPFQPVYPFYVVIIGVIGLFARFEWKGRKFR
ncbi:MAG: glycosyltransferase [Bacteroidetes bacterium]|nr:glycosyltransferase [Bacteroidota bacterium]